MIHHPYHIVFAQRRPGNQDRIFQCTPLNFHCDKQPGGQRGLAFIGFVHPDDDIDQACALIELAFCPDDPSRPGGFPAGNAGTDIDSRSRPVTRRKAGHMKPVKILILKWHHNLSLIGGKKRGQWLAGGNVLTDINLLLADTTVKGRFDFGALQIQLGFLKISPVGCEFGPGCCQLRFLGNQGRYLVVLGVGFIQQAPFLPGYRRFFLGNL